MLRQIDINQLDEYPSQLGHPQGLKEQHPVDVQQDSTFSPILTYSICLCLGYSRQTDFNQFHEYPSQHPNSVQQDST